MNKQRMNVKGMISLGYLFMAIIILFNYIGKKPDKVAAHGAAGLGGLTPDMQALKLELDEERRVNREMRRMLSQVQQALNKAPNGTAPGAQPSAPSFDFDAVLENGLPEIRSDIGRSRRKSSPFVPGKNPYLPFYARAGQAEVPAPPVVEPSTVSGIDVRCDPKIPYFLQGKWLPAQLLEPQLH